MFVGAVRICKTPRAFEGKNVREIYGPVNEEKAGE